MATQQLSMKRAKRDGDCAAKTSVAKHACTPRPWDTPTPSFSDTQPRRRIVRSIAAPNNIKREKIVRAGVETCRSLLILLLAISRSNECAMFYTLELTRQLEIPPRYFGPKLLQEIERRLRLEVEGSCSGLHGFVIAVTGVVRGGVQRGVIREGVGSAVFKVTYESFVFMPHKGEVIDAVVKSVNKARPERL